MIYHTKKNLFWLISLKKLTTSIDVPQPLTIVYTPIYCQYKNNTISTTHWLIQSVRQGRVPGGPNSLIFMQFSAKRLQNNPTLAVDAPLRKILNPPLQHAHFLQDNRCKGP